MKILIFGGAFNPVHKEHINILSSAIQCVGAERTIIVPTGVSPHKHDKLTVTDAVRVKACELAFASIKNTSVCTYEIEKGGVSYSYLTCKYFKNLYPNDELYFLMGADMLKYFPKWKYPEEILKCVSLVVCQRDGVEDFSSAVQEIEREYNTKIYVANYVGEAVSSTKIRTLYALGEDVSDCVLQSVNEYLKSVKAYRLDNLIKAKDFLTEKRWMHSVRVAMICAENCSRANLTEEQAITMGALHDVAKYLPLDSPYLEGFSLNDGVPNPVIHQYTGAYVAKNTFGVTDKTLLSAIRCHTSAKAEMTAADVLLYLADLLEPNRDFSGVDELRKIFSRDMQKCITVALERQIDYLCYKGVKIYEETLNAYEYFKEKYKYGK